MRKFLVKKVINNNVVLAYDKNTEYILIGRGLGFSNKVGSYVDEAKAEKIFIGEKELLEKIDELNKVVGDEVVGVCEETVALIEREMNVKLEEDAHIRLIDHIAFALKRLREDGEIENPFVLEIQTLYKRDFEIAAKAIRFLEERLGIRIPFGEIGFIALHIHSARNRASLSEVLRYVDVCNKVVEYLEKNIGIKIDKSSFDYARFITHIRYAIYRIKNNIPIRNELKKSIKRTYKETYRIAIELSKIISQEISKEVPEDEIAFMAMHIARLKDSIVTPTE